MPHSLLLVEMIARLSLRDGAVARCPKPSGLSEVEERNAGIVIVFSMKMRGGRAAITPGDHGRTARSDLRSPREQARSAQSLRGSASGGDKAILPAGSGERSWQ